MRQPSYCDSFVWERLLNNRPWTIGSFQSAHMAVWGFPANRHEADRFNAEFLGVEPVMFRGFWLRDINQNFFNCGHYPEWIVEPGICDSRDLADNDFYLVLEDAEYAVTVRNEASSRRWHEFLQL